MQSILQSSALGTLFSCPVPSYFYSMLLFPCPAIAISLSQPVLTLPMPLQDVWHSLTGLLKTRQLHNIRVNVDGGASVRVFLPDEKLLQIEN